MIFWNTQEFHFILDKSYTLNNHNSWNVIKKHFYFVFLYPFNIYAAE